MIVNKILCPTDFSECAFNAAEYALRFAEEMGSELIFVNVQNIPVVEVYSPADVLKEMMDTQSKFAEQKMEALFERLETSQKLKGEVVFGNIQEKITEFAHQNDCDLIIMGSHGESNAINRFLGSISYETMKKQDFPGLVIPMDSKYQEFNRVALAVPAHVGNEDSLSTIFNITHNSKPEIHVISVIPDAKDFDFEIISDEGGIKEINIHAASPETGIQQYLEQKDMDMIVLRQTHKSLFERIFKRSTIKQVLGSVHIPVLILNK
ncbi:universal stress protein [bacterium]|nr:universal stress protein [bacterium]